MTPFALGVLPLGILASGIGAGALSPACWLLALFLRSTAGSRDGVKAAALVLALAGTIAGSIGLIDEAAVKAAVQAEEAKAAAAAKPAPKPKADKTIAVPKSKTKSEVPESIPAKPAEVKVPVNPVAFAERINSLNRYLASLTLLLVVSTLAIQYVFGFNTTLTHALSLPISGRWLELLSPSHYNVNLPALDPARLLKQLAARGENFIFFGVTDPFDETVSALPRFALGPIKLGQLHLVRGNDEFASPDPDADDVQLLLEYAWIGKSAVILTEDDSASEWLERIQQYLQRRQQSIQSTGREDRAAQVLNIVWSLNSPPALDLGKELCSATNCRWIRMSHSNLPFTP